MTSPEANGHDAVKGDGETDQKSTPVKGAAGVQWRELARRAQNGFSGFPSNLAEQMKKAPYKTLGLAVAAGMGVGLVLGSRILRAVLASTASYAVVEIARLYVRERLARPEVAAVVRS